MLVAVWAFFLCCCIFLGLLFAFHDMFVFATLSVNTLMAFEELDFEDVCLNNQQPDASWCTSLNEPLIGL